MNKIDTTPTNGTEYLESLKNKERPPLAPTYFKLIPNKVSIDSQITGSLVYTEAGEIWNHDLFNKEGRVPVDVCDTK